ncbi:MASP1 protease, partial [Polypterus senegalus]
MVERGELPNPKVKSYEEVKNHFTDPLFTVKMGIFNNIAREIIILLTDKPIQPFLSQEVHKLIKVECSDNIFIEQSGIITSSDFPNPYPKSSDCLYRIELEEGFIINLEFDDSFDIEDHPEVTCPYDYLKIKAGQNEFGPFCGDQSPGKIEMGSNRVQILFHSDNSGDNGGWKLTYSAVVVDCKNAPDLQFGSVIYNSLSNLTTYRSTVHYSCQIPRYQMYPAINGTYICGEKGFWINDELGAKLPSCLPVCGQPARQLPGLLKRIVGGRTAEPGFFPWQALIMVEDVSRVPEGKWFGSGALLSDSWVLTAAHVLRSPRRDNTVIPVSEEHVTIYLGLHDVRNKTDAINRTAEKIVLHERFDPKNYNNDIALVKLKKKVKMSQFIMPVCLPTTDQSETEPQPQALGLVAGWGLSNPNVSMDEATSSDFGTVSDVLQYVLQDTLLQREEELARLHDENNKLKEYLNSTLVKCLEEKAKKLLHGVNTDDVKVRNRKRRLRDEALHNFTASQLLPGSYQKKTRRNLSLEFCTAEEVANTPPVDSWVLQTLGLKDLNTIDESANYSAISSNLLPPLKEKNVFPTARPMDYNDSNSVSPAMGFRPDPVANENFTAVTLPLNSSCCHQPASSQGLPSPLTGSTASSPFKSPYSPEVTRSKPDVAFTMSLNPHRNVKTHSFDQGQAFVRRDENGGWKFTWVPKQSD